MPLVLAAPGTGKSRWVKNHTDWYDMDELYSDLHTAEAIDKEVEKDRKYKNIIGSLFWEIKPDAIVFIDPKLHEQRVKSREDLKWETVKKVVDALRTLAKEKNVPVFDSFDKAAEAVTRSVDWTQLPPVLLEKSIFSRLESVDLKRASGTNRAWKRAALNLGLQQVLILKEQYELILKVLKTELPKDATIEWTSIENKTVSGVVIEDNILVDDEMASHTLKLVTATGRKKDERCYVQYGTEDNINKPCIFFNCVDYGDPRFGIPTLAIDKIIINTQTYDIKEHNENFKNLQNLLVGPIIAKFGTELPATSKITVMFSNGEQKTFVVEKDKFELKQDIINCDEEYDQTNDRRFFHITTIKGDDGEPCDFPYIIENDLYASVRAERKTDDVILFGKKVKYIL